MLNRTVILATLCVAGAVAPALAQDAGPRPLLPLSVELGQFMAVGEASFGAESATQTIEGFGAQDFDSVVLMARDSLLLCSGFNITFASGEEEAYPLLAPGLLSQSQLYQIEPTGEEAEIASITATCRAPGNAEATLAFYGKAGQVFVPTNTTAVEH
jgi:hypothetical protein